MNGVLLNSTATGIGAVLNTGPASPILIFPMCHADGRHGAC